MTKVFIIKDWDFGEEDWGIIGFHGEAYCNSLINRSSPGDFVAIIGTLQEPTEEEDRGRLLGMATFHREMANGEELVGKAQRQRPECYENGKFKWPHAVKIEKAYLFTEKPLAREIIKRNLGGQVASGQAVLLDEEDANAVLALARKKISVS